MARRAQAEAFHFEGFEYPTTTPVPDVIFDAFLSRLGEAELKALLYIVRRTFGFKKDRDAISFNQFLRGIKTREGQVLDEGCGVKDRTTLSRALQSLEAMGIIRSEKGIDARGENETTVYSLRFKGDAPPAVSAPPPAPEAVGNSYHPAGNYPEGRAGVVGNSYQGGRETLPGVVGIPHYRGRETPPGVVGNAYPQQTVIQETEGQDHSNIRKASTFYVNVDNSVDNSVDNPDTLDAFSQDAPRLAATVSHPVALLPQEPTPQPHAHAPVSLVADSAVIANVEPSAGATMTTSARGDSRSAPTRRDMAPTVEQSASAVRAARAPSLRPRWGDGLPANQFLPEAPAGAGRNGREGDATLVSAPLAVPALGMARSDPATAGTAAGDATLSALPAPSSTYGRKPQPEPSGAGATDARRGQASMFPLAPADPETSRDDHVIVEAAYDASRDLLARFVEDFAREFNDQAPLRSTLSRLANLYGRSGLPMETFVAHLYAARQTTQERTGAIRTRAGEGIAKNKMVYFFGVLENRLGLGDHTESSDLAAMLARSGS